MSIKPEYRTLLMGWVESLVITILFIIISQILDDPLSLKSSFPWIWFAPLLIALRYGVWPSQCSILLLLFTYLYRYPTEFYSIHLQLFVLGGFLLTLACGIFQNATSTKIKYSDRISKYLRNRIQTTVYAYKTLVLAYQHLEHNFIARPITIRTSLGNLRQMLANADEHSEKDILNRLLNILAIRCNLEIAGIFPVKNKQIIPESIVSIGEIKQPKANDFLIKGCIETAALTYITSKEILKGHASDYLVVAPLINQEDEIYALLIIEEMPFLSLNEDNLEVVNLLLQYFTEGKTVKNADLILKKFPDCTVDFANELQRLTNIQKTTKRDSAVIAFIFLDTLHRDDYLFAMELEKRGLDTSWKSVKGDKKILLVLMPLTDREGVESFKIRIDEVLSKNFGITLNNDQIKFRYCQLSSMTDPIHLIQDLLNTEC